VADQDEPLRLKGGRFCLRRDVVDREEIPTAKAACSPKGNLSFHWKCIMAPPTIIGYIVVHEICHFHHLDHTEAFWNEVDKIISQYRKRKEWHLDGRVGSLVKHSDSVKLEISRTQSVGRAFS